MVEELNSVIYRKGAGMHARAHVHLRDVDPHKAMFITLRNLFNSFTSPMLPAALANSIGRMIEDEIRFSRFQDKYADYYKEIMDDFRRKGTKNYRYMHRVLTHSANSKDDGWIPWSIAERVDVGMRLLDIILRCSDLVEKKQSFIKGKTITSLEPTEAALKWVSEYDEAAAFMYPEKAPTIIPPDPWTEIDQGGYFSPELRSSTKLVLTNHPKHRQILRKADLTSVMDAVNGAQSVGWKVNTKVLEIVRAIWAKNLGIGMPASEKLKPSESPVKDIPKELLTPEQEQKLTAWKREASEIYTKERERQSKCFQVTRILKMANDYNNFNEFWYVWTLDFRGRMYTTTAGFSPQGPDLAKGMLMFAEGKTLGERGVYWLKVHGANRFGFDKEDYDERVKWVDERHAMFMAAAADPISHVDVWKGADKPYQFLAFLFEYKEMYDGLIVGKKCSDYVSYLPIGLDGSCNGLQHFSAMLRDEVGGKATNLVSGDKPSDIYSEVAAVCLRKVRECKEAEFMQAWESFAVQHGKGKLPRSVAKRPVMTMPYGSTRQSCTAYVNDAVCEYNKDHFGKLQAFKASVALTPLLWTSIGEVVVAARQGMDWLQDCATVMNRGGLAVTWRTKDGFIVHQHERQIEKFQIKTQLAGMYQVKVGNYTDALDKHAQRNGVAPNFVHSQDAAHLRATIRKARAEGIASLALIHDDYGTHAASTDTLHRIIRECFVEQYLEYCPLTEFKTWQELISKRTMPAMPAKGTLDITEVLRSQFFFG